MLGVWHLCSLGLSETAEGGGGGWDGGRRGWGTEGVGNDHVHSLVLLNFVTGMNWMWRNLRAVGPTLGGT